MSAPAPQQPAAAPAGAPGRMLQLRLESKPIIYASYMSFLEYGGVFMPTNDKFNMGEEVLLVLELVGSTKTEKMFIKTNVCWINANPSASGRPKGVGLAFGSDESGLKAKEQFETILTGLLHNERATYTL
ncbi:pilus assembly protein [Kingella negevensis]|uniref:PilZ domain-containing protein n=1 Tax=Kingella negevensis TaxID=1522312 RepID=UPI002550F4D3|nr:pilus assembly protein [Kingella negevensis]MDK4684798.1 pilus assembly protein [Kingella negevensis]MDK4707339.1 pilus assembly protein [Kingella negevensis]MDK4710183.1 pilus assembly protein [Kingella negevensis]